MRTYAYASMVVDGNETAKLEIIREHNIFRIYEHDENVFEGSYTGATKYIEDWKARKQEIRTFLEQLGHFVTFEQSIG